MSDWLDDCLTRSDLLTGLAAAYAPTSPVLAEVGVYMGDFSEEMLRSVPSAKVYAIDPWAAFAASDWNDPINKQLKLTEAWKTAVKRIAAYGDRGLVLRKTSLEAARQFDDEFFDLVYIDANHCERAVREDLAAWYPKVRTGGILAGHDFTYGYADVIGVVPAVLDFAREHRLKLSLMVSTSDTSWALRKKRLP